MVFFFFFFGGELIDGNHISHLSLYLQPRNAILCTHVLPRKVILGTNVLPKCVLLDLKKRRKYLLAVLRLYADHWTGQNRDKSYNKTYRFDGKCTDDSADLFAPPTIRSRHLRKSAVAASHSLVRKASTPHHENAISIIKKPFLPD
jgi:hypothetical protein